MRRLRRYLLRLLPPVLFVVVLALSTSSPARAAVDTADYFPTPAEGYHCADLLADRWLESLPSDLIVREASGAYAPYAVTKRERARGGWRYFLWLPIWRQYSIAGARYNARVWVFTWVDEGTIRCSRRGQRIIVEPGPSPYNPGWQG